MPASHFDDHGHPHMVDVSGKSVTTRIAVAEVVVSMQTATLLSIQQVTTSKGDVLAIARLAAIQATKQTATLIPLCHSIPIESVHVQFRFPSTSQVACEVTVKTTSRTGVEMEAMTAAAIAGLTIYDMCKSMDRAMVIGPLLLVSKQGGASGDFRRES